MTGRRLDLNFASDNVAAASGPVMEALVRANAGSAPAYGADEVSRRVEARFAEIFEREVAVFPVATGTAANALALAAAVEPWGAILCHEEAHVVEDECGAPEFFTGGAKLIGIPGVGSRITAADLAARLASLPAHAKQMPAQAVTISQATESGLVYHPGEVAAIAEVCRGRGLALHMDGARFANALVTLGISAAAMTWRAGIDILSFGATKNGCFAAEAIIVFDAALARGLDHRRKRAGQVLSKGRLIAAQFDGYLAEDHWLANARHANRMAATLSAGLAAIPGVRLAWPTQVNEVFAILPHPVEEALGAAGVAFHRWSSRALAPENPVGPGEALVRLVASFATQEQAVKAVLAAARRA